jgi:hypothetical protein
MLVLAAAGDYVAAAYGVFVTLIVIYVAIIGSKLQRMERQLDEVLQLVEERER